VIPALPFETAEEIRAELTASFAPRRMAP
jgi:hypothetical protein